MNSFVDFVCRGIVRSEDAIRCLNKRTTKLAKCCRQTNAAVLCFGVASLLTLAVIAEQDREIKALRNRVEELAKDVADVEDHADYLAKTMEEQNKQEGA
jgi:cell division protein FtsB